MILRQKYLDHHYATAHLTCRSTVEEFFEVMFPMLFVWRLYNEDTSQVDSHDSGVDGQESEVGIGDESVELYCQTLIQRND
jgi:hypothetical protein